MRSKSRCACDEEIDRQVSVSHSAIDRTWCAHALHSRRVGCARNFVVVVKYPMAAPLWRSVVKTMMGIGGTSSPGTAVQMSTGPSAILQGVAVATDDDDQRITIANSSSQTLYVAMGDGSASDINANETLTQDAIDAGAIAPGKSTTRGFDLGNDANYVYIWRSTAIKTPAAYMAIDGSGTSVVASGNKWYLATAAFDAASMTITVKDSPAYAARWYAVGAIALILVLAIWWRFRSPPAPVPIRSPAAPAAPASLPPPPVTATAPTPSPPERMAAPPAVQTPVRAPPVAPAPGGAA